MDLAAVRRFPEQQQRVETGPIMFGDDWPGVFIRGKHAFFYSIHLRNLLAKEASAEQRSLSEAVVKGLLDDLESSHCRNNDAYPSWHEEEP